MYLANFSSLGDSSLVDQLGLVGLVAQVKVSLLQLPFRGSQVTHSVINITLGIRQCHPAVIHAAHQHLQLCTGCVYGMRQYHPAVIHAAYWHVCRCTHVYLYGSRQCQFGNDPGTTLFRCVCFCVYRRITLAGGGMIVAQTEECIAHASCGDICLQHCRMWFCACVQQQLQSLCLVSQGPESVAATIACA